MKPCFHLKIYISKLYYLWMFLGKGRWITKLWFWHFLVFVAVQKISVAIKANLSPKTTLVSVLVWVFSLFFMFCIIIIHNIHISLIYKMGNIHREKIYFWRKLFKKIFQKNPIWKPLNSHKIHLCYSTKLKLFSHLAVNYCLRWFIYSL